MVPESARDPVRCDGMRPGPLGGPTGAAGIDDDSPLAQRWDYHLAIDVAPVDAPVGRLCTGGHILCALSPDAGLLALGQQLLDLVLHQVSQRTVG